jgi:hypothetical protein
VEWFYFKSNLFTMKKYFFLTLLLVGALFAQAGKVNLADVAKNPSKLAGKQVEFKGMVYSVCPKSDKRIFVSPENDKTVRVAVVLKSGSAASFRGKEVTVKGVLKKVTFVNPKPCGRCDGEDCAKSVSDGATASYYVEASSVK